MAERIQLLSDEVIGKIAAGEVVERPSAAIKELVENSLDAGATAITVEIRDGGISYFRVTDNGSGIRADDIRMAFERHATSKIRRTDDLFSIATLGFRGEALASIAAVAHVTCTTRTKNDTSGIKVQNNGGVIESIQDTACPEGTTFVVRDLFFNTPVRLKFLKKPVTEAGYVTDLMTRLILSRPDVSFRYISQGKTLYHSAGDGKLSSAVYSIYGSEMLRSMMEVSGHQSGVVLKGYVGTGDSGRGNRNHQSFFINGRYMKSALLSGALENACRERVANGKYPTCVLHLTMPYDTVDVNVHPNKLEVRFQDEAAVAEAVEDIICDAFPDKAPIDQPDPLFVSQQHSTAVPVTVVKQSAGESAVTKVASAAVQKEETKSLHAETPAEAVPAWKQPLVMRSPSVLAANYNADTQSPIVQASVSEKKASEQFVQVSPSAPTVQDEHKEQTAATKPEKQAQQIKQSIPAKELSQTMQANQVQPAEQLVMAEAQPTLQLIGTLFRSYILVEYKEQLLLIDQQAVHERVLFDRMMQLLDQHRCGQDLLIPMIVHVTRREQQLLEDHRQALEEIGFVVEPFGENEVSIRTIPMILGRPQTESFLRDIIDQLENERGLVTFEKRRAGIVALACKYSVHAGDSLNQRELQELVSKVADRHIMPVSPRGTPMVVALSKTEIDRRFRRG